MPLLRPLLTAALLLLLALTGSTLAEQLKVVSISDGDTFTGLDSQNRQVKVRLHGIDAPEKAQAFGNVSRKALGDLIEGKVVEVQQVDKDRYGRVVANVHVGGTHVNRELVAKGLAWRYVQYDKRASSRRSSKPPRPPARGSGLTRSPCRPGNGGRARRSGGQLARDKFGGTGLLTHTRLKPVHA